MVALVFADSDHKPWRTKLHHSQQSAATLLTLLLSEALLVCWILLWLFPIRKQPPFISPAKHSLGRTSDSLPVIKVEHQD
jgi:hypothetical protein